MVSRARVESMKNAMTRCVICNVGRPCCPPSAAPRPVSLLAPGFSVPALGGERQFTVEIQKVEVL